MRLLPVLLLALLRPLPAAEPAKVWPPYPLWDGVESVEQYAKKVNLPPTQTLDLGNNVKLELVLIPAGAFIMGTPEPPPVDENGYCRKIATGQAVLAATGGALLVMLLVVIARAMRRKRRPQLSLGLLLLVTVAAGGAVLSGLHWRQSARGLEQARVDYAAAKARFDAAPQYEKPGHPVTLTQPFYMASFLVTQRQFQQVMGANPSKFKTSMENPAQNISWFDAQDFCDKLAGLTKRNVRLPTEAEWEYSCRAGTQTIFCSGDADNDLDRVAWYAANSNATTHPVGQKEPNAFGLYDMHGNLWQWCQDGWGEDYYTKSPTEDPYGPAQPQPDAHVLRGGSFHDGPETCRSAYRAREGPGYHEINFGFRVRVAAPAPGTP